MASMAAGKIMKQKEKNDSLLERADDVFNAGMKLFAEVQQSNSVDMIKRQAELIELLDRLLSHGKPNRNAPKSESVETQFPAEDLFQEQSLKLSSLPSKDDLAGVCRYLLACWLDELFVVDTQLTRQWNENKLEIRMFGTNDRAWRFWDYVNSEPVSKNLEVSQIALSCIMHGFQGQLVESHAELAVWVEKCKAMLFQSARDSWSPPPSLPLMADTPPLKGFGKLEMVIQLAITAGVILVPAISFLIVYSLRT
jgi:type VI secretion system protein ImpK